MQTARNPRETRFKRRRCSRFLYHMPHRLLLLLLPLLASPGGAFELRVRHAARHPACHLSHPYGLLWEWAADVQIGTPPRTFQLQLDSGWNQMTLSTSEAPYQACPAVPMQTYRAASSSTSRMYTCADAKADGVSKCINCDGSQATAAEACISHTGIDGSGHTNYTWVSDTVRIAGVELANFSIGLFNNSGYRGSWGFKVDPSNLDPAAPPWSSMLHGLQRQGAISQLSYSMCFKASTSTGRIAFGELLPHSVSDAVAGRGIVTTEPMRWVDTRGPTVSASIGGTSIYRHNGSSLADRVLSGVDSGTIATRMPAIWAKQMVAQLEANCSSNPLVGVCVDSAGEPIPPGSRRSILKGTCHSLTAEQRKAFPDIVFGLPAADQAGPDVLLHYTPDMYLSRFSSPCVRRAFMIKDCEGPDDVLVTWAFMAWAMPNDYHDPGHLILGEDMYHSFLSYRNFENGTTGLARIQRCASD